MDGSKGITGRSPARVWTDSAITATDIASPVQDLNPAIRQRPGPGEWLDG
ncbi:MAG: hypothetical protein ACO3JG_11295 [Luteolibacter sp.]